MYTESKEADRKTEISIQLDRPGVWPYVHTKKFWKTDQPVFVCVGGFEESGQIISSRPHTDTAFKGSLDDTLGEVCSPLEIFGTAAVDNDSEQSQCLLLHWLGPTGGQKLNERARASENTGASRHSMKERAQTQVTNTSRQINDKGSGVSGSETEQEIRKVCRGDRLQLQLR